MNAPSPSITKIAAISLVLVISAAALTFTMRPSPNVEQPQDAEQLPPEPSAQTVQAPQTPTNPHVTTKTTQRVLVSSEPSPHALPLPKLMPVQVNPTPARDPEEGPDILVIGRQHEPNEAWPQAQFGSKGLTESEKKTQSKGLGPMSWMARQPKAEADAIRKTIDTSLALNTQQHHQDRAHVQGVLQEVAKRAVIECGPPEDAQIRRIVLRATLRSDAQRTQVAGVAVKHHGGVRDDVFFGCLLGALRNVSVKRPLDATLTEALIPLDF